MKRTDRRPQKGGWPKAAKPSWALAWIAFGWVAAFIAILMLLNFHPVVKTEPESYANLWIVWPVFFLGLAAMVQGYRVLDPFPQKDLGRTSAWIGMALILAAGAWMRLYNLGHPPGPFWDDWATVLVWTHTMLDKNQLFWMLPTDGIEPFVPYVITGLQALLPDEVKDFTVRRLAACSIDIAALGMLYLCGKELVSRRAGIVAAALGALGRPMIQLTLTGMRAYSLSLAVTFLILASLKLFRKPSWGHFLLWGFALAFGVHTYTSFRVFMLVIPFLLLPWALRGPERTPFWAWGGMAGASFLLLGTYSGTIASTYSGFVPWNALWEQWKSQPSTMIVIFTVALALAVVSAVASNREDRSPRLAGLSLALVLACALIYPLTLSDQFDQRLASVSAFRESPGLGQVLSHLVGQAVQTLRSLFFACMDRNDLLIATDPFYDLFSQGALFLGLAFFIARPDWRKGFLLLTAALGTLVYVLSIDPASTKLIGSAPGFYLLAGWAISQLWAGLPRPGRRGYGWLGALLASLLTLYAVWGGWIQNQKLFGYWAKIPMADTELARRVGEDEKEHRVYLVPSPWFYGTNSQFILNEGRRYYFLRPQNPIPVKKGELPPDVVLFVYGPNATMVKTLRERFHTAQWEKKFVFREVPGDLNPELYMWRVLIPGSVLSRTKDPLFTLVEEEGSWLKQYYDGFYGWGLGGILGEEWLGGFSGTIPFEKLGYPQYQGMNHDWLVRIRGPLAVPQDGDYEWTFDSPDAIWFRIDGRTVLKKDSIGPPTLFRRKVHLSQGTHDVEARMRYPDAYLTPRIEWRRAGDKDRLPFEVPNAR